VRALGQVWRQRLWVWVPALVFFLLNAVAFSVYRLGYAGRVEKLDETLAAQETQLEDLEARKRDLDTMIGRVRTNDDEVEKLYAERLAPRSRRLTGISAEVKRLAQQAGMVPRALSYPEEEIESYGLIKRSFIFTVEGTYSELRKLVSLLETSPSFLALEEVTVSGGGDQPELKIDLTISTLFADEGGAPVAAATPPAPGGTS
jgi:Tfp pilus assembly protein PilO